MAEVKDGIKVAIIATVLNERTNIDQLLTDLLSQSRSPEQIVIVDGGSTDGTWERLLAFSQEMPSLKVLRDETCSLRNCPGPIGRGRNRAIEEAEVDVIACADASCHYHHDWLELLVKPIIERKADFVIGGSCFDREGQTAWDIASAPFLGLDLQGEGMPRTPTGTARSLAFTKRLWSDIGRFSENTLCGEDTEFLVRLKKNGRAASVDRARAIYREHFTFREAVTRIRRYAQADGLNRLCGGRFWRMMCRASFGCVSVILVTKYWYPFMLYIFMELIFALKHDFRGLLKKYYLSYVPIRIIFSLLVPYIFISGYIGGLCNRPQQMNRQNI